MTPKEKAIEIFNKFLKFQVLTIGFDNDINSEFTRRQRAKQCALICVDEILNNSQRNGKDIWRLPFYSDNEILLSDANYWNEVKTEIEKL
jgi:hypothetical protein